MHHGTTVETPTPVINVLTNLAGVINRIDYARTGLTLERMGLADRTADQIRVLVN
jgi:hypothetical protein